MANKIAINATEIIPLFDENAVNILFGTKLQKKFWE